MRNLFAIAALLAATSSASSALEPSDIDYSTFDFEALSNQPIKYLSRAAQRSSDRLNKKTGRKPVQKPPRRDYSRPIKEPKRSSSQKGNPWVRTNSWSNANRSK